MHTDYEIRLEDKEVEGKVGGELMKKKWRESDNNNELKVGL